MQVLVEAPKPADATRLVIHTGTPTDGDTFELPAAYLARVWGDGTLTAFDETGAVLMYLKPSTFWAYQWQ